MRVGHRAVGSEGQKEAAVLWNVCMAKCHLPLGWDAGALLCTSATPCHLCPGEIEGTHRALVLLRGTGLQCGHSSWGLGGQ